MPMVRRIHLWGKRRNSKGRRIPHQGDLRSYLENQDDGRLAFLEGLRSLLSDDDARYLVPEVNGRAEELLSVIADLDSVGVQFTDIPLSAPSKKSD